MRLLQTTKPIPPWYLKSGKDNGSYDLEKLVWLPGRIRPYRKPDVKLAGKHNRGEVSPLVAPPSAARPVSEGKATKTREGTGLLIPKREPYKPQPLVIARH